MALIIDSDMFKMPPNCHECLLCFSGLCFAAPSESDGNCPDEGKPDWCPLSEVEQNAEWLLSRPHHFQCSGCGAQWGLAVIGMRYCPTCGRKMTLSAEERMREWGD